MALEISLEDAVLALILYCGLPGMMTEILHCQQKETN
jgi:hypothetical protein